MNIKYKQVNKSYKMEFDQSIKYFKFNSYHTFERYEVKNLSVNK